jgi:DNA mismatch repair protein MutS2
MQAAALRALEFDRIREALAQAALTPLGRTRALVLEPSVDAEEVRRRLALTTEAVAFVEDDGSLAVSAPEDLQTTLRGLELGEDPLEPLQLQGLAQFVESVDEVAAAIRQTSRPGLREVALGAASFASEAAAIRRAIEPGGEVRDSASPALKDIRDKLRRQRTKLRSTLEALTRGRESAKYLQDQIVTDRNGRYVVVVRAEHRGAIPGIVHGSSASGASLYLEPLTTVELNNDIVALAEREKEEVRRILLALTNAFRQRADDLERTLDAGAALDELYSKVQLARRLQAVAPELTTDGRIELLGARHPLLGTADAVAPPANSLPATPQAIPSDLTILPPTQALVISGPNTGGKTVALKAFGLLVLMAQAGLLIPVERGSKFTPFRSVFADIGDDQSIAASLSTFSAHIAHLVEMDRALELPALVLLDEVGGGTDPQEGGALGTAVIEHFRRRGAVVVATTHDEALKSYAATTAGVATAGFGFDPETYAPTYRIVYGAPGRSLALEIAERLGMPSSVISDARARRSGRESQLAAHLARVDHELAALDRERKAAADDRKALAAERERVLEREARLAEREAVLKRRLDDRLNEKLREARAEIDRIVTELKQKAEALGDRAAGRGPATRKPTLTTGDLGSLRAEARVALTAVGDNLGDRASAEADLRLEAPPAPGQTVFVATFGADAIVRGVSGDRIDVEVRGMRMRVTLADLRLRRPDAARAGDDAARTGRSGTARVSTPTLASSAATRELVVIGCTVDEAIARAEKFLDDALLADERRLRIVHGHGTGRLREALTKFFREHPLVASVALADDKEGGGGATIVELKE